MKIKTRKRILSILSLFTLLFQNITPVIVYASEATPSATIEAPTDQQNTLDQELTIDESSTTSAQSQENQEESTQAPTLESTVIHQETTPTEESDTTLADILDESQTSESSATPTIYTDKADYYPTDKALITGNDLLPNQEYLLIVRSNDPPEVNFETTITTNDLGSFTYWYQLDGTYRPNYFVDLYLGSELVASTTFTDSASIVLDQCKNGDFSSPVNCDFEGSNTGWGSGNANSANAHLVEGQSQAYRIYSPTVPVGSHSITYSFDYTKGGKIAQDFPTRYDNMGSTLVDPTAGKGFSGSPTSSYVFPPMDIANGIPADIAATTAMTKTLAVQSAFYAANPGLSTLSMWGGNITGISYSFDGTAANVVSGDTSVLVTIAFDMATEGEMLISMGGHISKIKDYEPDPDTAIFISGSPYHHNVLDASYTNVGNQDNQLAASAIIPEGDIIIRKVTVPDTDTTTMFNFSGDLGDFILTGGSEDTFGNLDVGVYTVTEIQNPAWSTEISCEGDTDQGSVISGSSVDIDLDNGELITCTFTNTLHTGSITVDKITDPSGSPEVFNFDLRGPTPGFVGLADQDNPHTFTDLLPGTYELSEVIPAGWDQSSAVCTGGNDTDPANITLDPDEHLTCTFENTQRGQINVVKNSIGGDDTFSFTSSTLTGFDLNTVSGTAVQEFPNLLPGAYDVEETVPAGWQLTSTSCVSSNQDVETADNLDLNPGEIITCTFENTKLGSISGIKFEDVDGDGSFAPPDVLLSDPSFTIFLDTNQNGTLDAGESSTQTLNGAYSFTNLIPGDHTVCEEEVTGWTQTYPSSGNCHTVNVDPSDPTANKIDYQNINFGNFKNVSISGYKYEDMNGDGDDENQVDPKIPAWHTIHISGPEGYTNSQVTDASGYFSFTDLGPGTYQVYETIDNDPTGWLQTGGENPYTIPVISGQDVDGIIFGNFEYAKVWGYKYEDLNADGYLDPEDLANPQEGWMIDLTGEGSEYTDISGYYEFTGLTAGNYSISEDLSLFPGWNQSLIRLDGLDYSFDGNFTIQSGDLIQVDFGNYTKGDLIVCKENDLGEPVVGWAMTILGAESQDTGKDGCTTFQLDPGIYSVEEEMWTNWTPLGNTIENRIQVKSGETTGPITFTNARPAELTIYKFNDIYGDGPTPTDPALAGWYFNVYEGLCSEDGLQVAGPIITNSNGEANVNLPIGNYCVEEINQGGWNNTYPGYLKQDVSLTSGSNSPVEFGNQGRGTITVYKDLDTNGDGQADQFNVSNWTYDIDYVGDYTMGSTQSVAAGVYEITEDSQTNYHFLSLDCPGQRVTSSTGEVTVNPGDEIVCTYTNSLDTGSISGTKYNDYDGDGVIENEDAPLAGVTIALYDYPFAGAAIDTTVTNASGYYEFDLVPTGTYAICEVTPVGRIQTYPNFGTTGAVVSDNDMCHEVIITSNDQTIENIDFANFKLGYLSGHKYHDLNNNGTWDQGEPELEGWRIYLDRPEGVDIYRTTNSSGYYSFSDLGPGEYTLYEEISTQQQADGWTQTGPVGDTYTIQMTSGADGIDNPNLDFGNLLLIDVGGYKWHDRNGNGTEDGQEEFLAGWTINIEKKDVQGAYQPYDSKITDNLGEYQFDDLYPGDYRICEDINSQTNYQQTYPTTNGGCYEFSIPSRVGLPTFKFGNRGWGKVEGYKWNDINGDGLWDDGEEGLEDWQIFIDQNDNQAYDAGESSMLTNVNGWYLFDLPVGDYTICETLQSGWVQTFPGSEQQVACHDITIEAGDSITDRNFGNQGRGTITIIKDAIPDDPQDFEFNLLSDLNDLYKFYLDDDQEVALLSNKITFDNIPAANYTITETQIEGWDLESVECTGQEKFENGSSFELNPGDEITCTFTNTKRGRVTVIKYNDLDSDGVRDEGESTLEGWEMNLSYGDGQLLSQITDQSGSTIFENLYAGSYYLSETLKPYWELTNISCDNPEEEFSSDFLQVARVINKNSKYIYVDYGSDITCEVGNKQILPVLTIAKSNDATTTQKPGSDVLYTLVVKLTENDLQGVTVTDLPPEGFTYRSGSWTASSSVRGDLKALGITTEPTYASPGTWQLGDMVAGEEVTLTYIADISSSQDYGNYPDLAWAQGTFAEEQQILAISETDDTTNFVGTEVIISDSETPLAEYGGGQVLGASTELPATGANIIWLLIALGFILTGTIFITISKKAEN